MDAMLVFDHELFDRRCAELGAHTERERAALVGVDMSTLWRFRKGEMRPRLEVAHRFAQRLDLPIDDLWKQQVA